VKSIFYRKSAKRAEFFRSSPPFLRQYRTKIVVQTHSQIFRQIVQNDAGIPAYFKEFWTKMTKKMQAYARQSAQRGLCAVALNPLLTHILSACGFPFGET